MVTEKQTRTSHLLISRALPTDSGNYTCAPSTAESASVLVHVLNGKSYKNIYIRNTNYFHGNPEVTIDVTGGQGPNYLKIKKK